jgi:uncharacterized protein YkwD
MKKLLVTSVCTLGLTLLGAFGNYQNSLAFANELGAVKCTTNVEQCITDINLKCLPDYNNSLACPAVNQDTSNYIKAMQNAVNNAKCVAQKSNCIKSNTKKVKGISTTKPSLVYKNVNLSNCKSKKDVVKKLQKNGVKGITTSNINDIKGLKNILVYIQRNCKNTNQNTTTNSTPTQTPASTTKPTPTQTPAPTTKPASTATPSSDLSSYANQVLNIVNQERAKAGLPALTTNKTLQAAANKRAQEIVQSFSHTRPDGSSCFTVLNDYGISYRSAGENIAYGQRTPAEVMNGWMNSPGHRANILKNGFGKVGIGVYKVNGVLYWTQEFTN